MKKVYVFFSLLLLMAFLTNCRNNEGSGTIDDELFKNIVAKDLSVFKNHDSVNYITSEYYKKAIYISDIADNIVQLISEDKLTEDTLNSYINHLNEFSRMKDFIISYKSFENIANQEKIFKIRTFQSLAVNRLLNI